MRRFALFAALLVGLLGVAFAGSGVLFPVKVGHRLGFIDSAGKVVVKPQFSYAEHFYDGMALVGVRSGDDLKLGFVNADGKVVVRPQFGMACRFSEGLAPVAVGGKWGYIDHAGRFVIKPQFDSISGFSGGLARVGRLGKRGYTYSFIDRKGVQVIKGPFSAAEDFSEGLAFCVPVRAGSDAGYIDRNGRVVLRVSKSSMGMPGIGGQGGFSEGLAVANDPSGRTLLSGYIDKTGRMVIAPRFGWAGRFHEGMAAVIVGESNGRSKWGFIDRSGRVVIKPRFDLAYEFSEGLACVRVKGKWGFVDKAGRYVVAPRYEYVESFRKGLARVRSVESRGKRVVRYIDRAGKCVWRSN